MDHKKCSVYHKVKCYCMEVLFWWRFPHFHPGYVLQYFGWPEKRSKKNSFFQILPITIGSPATAPKITATSKVFIPIFQSVKLATAHKSFASPARKTFNLQQNIPTASIIKKPRNASKICLCGIWRYYSDGGFRTFIRDMYCNISDDRKKDRKKTGTGLWEKEIIRCSKSLQNSMK